MSHTAPQTAEERSEELRRARAKLHRQRETPWEPEIVHRAFALDGCTPLAPSAPWVLKPLTFRTWLALDAAHSPLLARPYMPLPQGDEGLQHLAFAIGMLSGTVVEHEDIIATLRPEAASIVADVIRLHLGEAFATELKLTQPGPPSESRPPDGMGLWLVLFARVMAELTHDEEATFAMRVDRAIALLNAKRRNEGWLVHQPTYADRDGGIAAPAAEPKPETAR